MTHRLTDARLTRNMHLAITAPDAILKDRADIRASRIKPDNLIEPSRRTDWLFAFLLPKLVGRPDDLKFYCLARRCIVFRLVCEITPRNVDAHPSPQPFSSNGQSFLERGRIHSSAEGSRTFQIRCMARILDLPEWWEERIARKLERVKVIPVAHSHANADTEYKTSRIGEEYDCVETGLGSEGHHIIYRRRVKPNLIR